MATLDEIRPQRVDMAAVMGAPCPAGTDEPQGILAQKDVSDIAFDSFIDDDDERHDSPCSYFQRLFTDPSIGRMMRGKKIQV
jgi:hypothetical protein